MVSKTFTLNSEDYEEINKNFFNNSLVEIDVYDSSNNNVSNGKSLSSMQGSAIVNSSYATNGNHSNKDEFTSVQGADTIILDLGDEYDIKRVDIWRLWDNNFNYSFSNKFLYGLNSNRELCYKFYEQKEIFDEIFETSSGISYSVRD